MPCPLTTSSALAEELALCETFLELDGRNFHCWAHRMWVAEKMGLSAEEDFQFTSTKIMQVNYRRALLRCSRCNFAGRNLSIAAWGVVASVDFGPCHY